MQETAMSLRTRWGLMEIPAMVFAATKRQEISDVITF